MPCPPPNPLATDPQAACLSAAWPVVAKPQYATAPASLMGLPLEKRLRAQLRSNKDPSLIHHFNDHQHSCIIFPPATSITSTKLNDPHACASSNFDSSRLVRLIILADLTLLRAARDKRTRQVINRFCDNPQNDAKGRIPDPELQHLRTMVRHIVHDHMPSYWHLNNLYLQSPSDCLCCYCNCLIFPDLVY